MALLRQKLSSFVFSSSRNSLCLSIRKLISVAVADELINDDATVNSICDSFTRRETWDTLSRKFQLLQLNDYLVQKVLLKFQQPVDAKRALGFFHWSAKSKNFNHGSQSYGIMIHILVKARLVIDARALLESILKKNEGNSFDFSVVDSLLDSYEVTGSSPFVFDLLIQTCAKLRLIDFALCVCSHLEERGFSLSLISFNTLIHVVEKSDENHKVWKIYEQMIRKRVYPNAITVRIMINSLCKEGKLQETSDMLNRIHGSRCSASLIVNTCLIYRILEEGRVEDGVMLLKRMLQKNMVLDDIAYSLIVYAKVKTGSITSAWEVFEEMSKRGFRANSFLYTLFIGVHCRGGKIEEANCLMQEMENMGLKPYPETFNLLIEGCATSGHSEESLRMCEKMLDRGFLPSCSVFNMVIAKICEEGALKNANALLTMLLDKGFLPDETTYTNLILGYRKSGEIQEILKLYYEMEARLLSPGVSVFFVLIESLCQSGKLEEAEKYWKIMKDSSITPSLPIYQTLTLFYLKKGNRAKALGLYKEMMSNG